MGVDFEQTMKAVADLLASFGLDPNSLELQGTPERVASFWAERLNGYDCNLESEITPLVGDIHPCPVIVENVPFASTCEHHLAPFSGNVTLGYLPGEGGVVGLSKLIRVVHAFANRLQVQERMTWQIFEIIETRLRPTAWGVKVVAEHTCIAHRGIKAPNVPVTTILLGGTWKRDAPKAFQ